MGIKKIMCYVGAGLVLAGAGANTAKADSTTAAKEFSKRGLSYTQRSNEYANYVLNLDSIVEGDVKVEKTSLVEKPIAAKLNGYHDMLGVIANHNIEQAFVNPTENDHLSYGVYIDATEYNTDELIVINEKLNGMVAKFIASPKAEDLTAILDLIQSYPFTVSGRKAVYGFLVEMKAIAEFYELSVEDNYDVERLFGMEQSFGGNADIITYDATVQGTKCK